MIKELQYNGYSANPSDYECVDGDLATSLGLVQEDGALKPILPPKVIMELSSNEVVKYIHETSSICHYIILKSNGDLSWRTLSDDTQTLLRTFSTDIYQVNAVGNTLIILASDGMHYLLWKGDTDGYLYLGTEIPECPLSFGLQGEMVSDDEFDISFDSISEINFESEFTDDNKTVITEQVLAKVNSFIADNSTNAGKFIYPFLIRYAYRLYDSSLTKHSAPVLMIASSDLAPQVFWDRVSGKGSYSSATLRVVGVLHTLDYAVVSEEQQTELLNWTDIVSSVDIFVSAPIYTYDQSGECTNFVDVDDSDCYCVCKHTNQVLGEYTYPLRYQYNTISKLYSYTFATETSLYVYKTVSFSSNHSASSSDAYKLCTFLMGNAPIEAIVDYYLLSDSYSGVTTSTSGWFTDINGVAWSGSYLWSYSEIFFSDGSSIVSDPVRILTKYTADSEIYSYVFDSVVNYYQVSRYGTNSDWSTTFPSAPETTLSYPLSRLMLPKRSADDVKSDIKSCSQFYFLESINLEDLTTERTAISIEDEYLQSLVSREVMTDDYDSHDKLMPKYSFSYNSRLNVANIEKMLFKGQHASSLFNYSDGYVYNWTNLSPTYLDGIKYVYIFIFIKQDGRDIIVRGDTGQYGMYSPFLFLYYPNTNAYKAVIVKADYFNTYYEVSLEQHDFLNGSFYFGGWDDLSKTTTTIPAASSDTGRTIELLNKIYTSEVNNPYYFPLLGINTVGTGEIIGISSAAKALSQGQFGSFPLYAFSTEGIWALEISDTGSYSTKQVITRDVCINNDSITQIDSAVLFATNRGIMLISGSETQCISDILNSEDIFTIADLPKSDNLITIYNSKADDNEQITLDDITILPFIEFISACQMIYDYVHQRIIVYNPNVTYAYVYSMKSKMWGMMQSNISSGVNSYPEALAMTSEHTLVDFSDSDSNSVTGLVVTRPFKMDDPNVFKTIDTIIQRGYFEKDHISQVLYGSNDLFNWLPIWSSSDKYMRGFRGSPFKAFRLIVFCDFGKGESLRGWSVQYTPRMTNQLR